MTYENNAKTLFQLQCELTDAKVDKAVSEAINQVVSQIVSLRQEVQRDFNNLQHEMHHEIGGLRQEMGSRLSAVETALGMRHQARSEVRSRFLDYTFKLGWVLGVITLSGVISFLVAYSHIHY